MTDDVKPQKANNKALGICFLIATLGYVIPLHLIGGYFGDVVAVCALVIVISFSSMLSIGQNKSSYGMIFLAVTVLAVAVITARYFYGEIEPGFPIIL